MATQNRYYSNTATVTTLTSAGGINSGALQMQVGATTGFPVQFPFILRIEPATTSEEVVLVTSGAGTISNPYNIQRGYDGTTARAHSQGVVVKHGFSQIDFQDPQIHLNSTGPGGSPNPHSLPDTAWSAPACVSLYSTTLSSSATSINISSISQSYKNLRLYISAVGVSATTVLDLQMTFNNDTGANYGWGQGYVTNSSTTGSGQHSANTSQLKIGSVWANSSTNNPGVTVVDIPFYSQSTLFKGMTSLTSAQDGGISVWNLGYIGGIWRNTAAVNSIQLTIASSTSFAVGSAVSLYGLV